MKMFRWISVLLIVVMLAACAPAAASDAAGAKSPAGTDIPAGSDAYPAPTTEVTQSGYPAPAVEVPTVESGYPAPAANDNLPAACKVDGMHTYTDANGRFCFAYPADFSVEGDGLVGPAQDPDLARARLAILSEALESGKDLAGVIAARLAEYGDAAVKQADVQLGGEPSVSLEPVPGDPGSLDTVSVHGGEVITLRFQPDVETYPQGRMDRDALVDAVMKSFTWLK
ncbi:hypothetical protein LARV_02026 [Longilinea arvoryzae]|uniref:Uncharacterized protein n=1 Tax=Longilinea arvoryzae TaxID=360412 RepID=A0A0S7BGU1_9CHLR|nr:hypothetical protein [Longilinea arvoryzae]GAP14260.1 hypothetical protein LARV_02026 [Longilinea arvoryzae]